MNPFGFETFALLLIVLAVAALWSTVKMVPQGYNYTVENFGRYTRTLSPGLHILVPVMERVGAKMNMKEQVIDIPSQDIITRDNAMVTVDGVNFYQVLSAAKAAYEVEQLQGAIVNLTMTNIRTVMGSMDLDELLSNRDQINAKLLQVVDAATEAVGREGHAHRDQGHRAPARPRRQHGPADEGRAREARPDPRGRGPAPGRDPQGRRRDGGGEARCPGPQGSRLPRRRGARALRRGRGQGDRRW